MKDQNIKDAYLVIKPIMDKLHEQFIEMSLTSDEAENIDFSEYLNAFKNSSDKFEDIEKRKRKEIGATYKVGERFFLDKIENAIKEQEEKTNEGKKKKAERNDETSNDKGSKKAKPYECLTKKEILVYLSANVKDWANENSIDEEKLGNHIQQFKGFWGYMSGYNQNRKNYY